VQDSLLLRPRLIKALSVQHRFIFFRDDEKFGRRERYSGPTSDFKEKDGYKPNVKLDYIDDDGRVLNAKEAFRSAQIIAYLLLGYATMGKVACLLLSLST
jgi:hypothetical protein